MKQIMMFTISMPFRSRFKCAFRALMFGKVSFLNISDRTGKNVFIRKARKVKE